MKLIPHLLVYALPALAFVATAGRTFGQDQTMLDMDLEQLLQVSITGATLREESLKTVPSPTTVFTREQLDALGLDYLHELLALIPGVQVNRSADNSVNYSFSIRGRRQGGRAREVLLLVDGREISDPRASGADSALSLFPLANIERVEVIRGPASSIYGSGALTGVINIVSRKDTNRVRVSLGELARRTADLNVSYTSGDWTTNLFAHAEQDHGQAYRLQGRDTHDPRSVQAIDWNLGYKNTRVHAFVTRLSADDFYALERVNNDVNSYRQLSRHYRVEHTLNPGEQWKTDLSLNYQKTDQFLHAEVLPAGALFEVSSPASTEPMLAKAHLGGEAYRVQIANDLTVSPALSFQFGGQWTHERETDARTRNTYDLEQLAARDFPVTYYGDFSHSIAFGFEDSRSLGGVYTQALYNITDDTRFVGGLRHDRYESQRSYTSPRVGLIHQLTPYQTLKALYGEAFRAPNFGEIGILNNPVLVGNPNLNNEAVKTVELVWMGTWRHLDLGVAAYRNRYINPIQNGWLGNARTYINGESEDNYGANLRVDWQLNSLWILRAHYNKVIDLPDAFFREADEFGALVLNFQLNEWNWNLSAAYNGEREYLLTTTQRARLESYWVSNSQLRYQLNGDHSISLMAKNIFNERYATPPQGAGLINAVPNRGREASIAWQWGW